MYWRIRLVYIYWRAAEDGLLGWRNEEQKQCELSPTP